MEITPTSLKDVLLIKPRVFSDDRGSFFESWQKQRYAEAGISAQFVQDNVSSSRKGTLRGLHFQNPDGQGKLVSVLEGEVFDVAVDIRLGSPAFGKWVGVELSAENRSQLYIPPGFAHGFCVLSQCATFCYKCTAYYEPSSEKTIAWNDASLGITWPIASPLLSKKDLGGLPLSEISKDDLPQY